MLAIPSGSLLLTGWPNLASGDVIGFLSRRPNLDFFHTGLVMIGAGGALTLRHASQRRRRVVEQPLAEFIAANRVQHVAVLRAVQKPGVG